MKKKKHTVATTADNLEEKFDQGESVLDYFEDTEPQRVNVDFPTWAIQALDQEANRIGVPRQALIKMWIIGQLDQIKGKKKSA